jgi:hypothetical protein
MSKHVVVTSFTEAGYQKYGKNFIEGFRKFMPENVKLVVYYEGTNLRDGWKSINEVANLQNWLRVIAPFQLFSGALFDQYDIRYDARTNRVIFIQNHALRTFKGKVFWMDGDTHFHAPVPESFFDEVLPDDKLCCYLGREGWYDSETGFIGFNYKHPACENFLKIEENTLFSGIIFAQHAWWDMVVFDWSRKCFISQDPLLKDAFIDMAADLPRATMHVYVNSVLGKYFDHLKGNRKGKTSLKEDLIAERPEPYWQEIWHGGAQTKAA